MSTTPNSPLKYVPVLHDVDGLDATLLAELDHSQTNRAAGVVLEHDVTGLQLGEVVEESVGNTSSVEHHRGDLSRHTTRNGDNVVLRNNKALRPGS